MLISALASGWPGNVVYSVVVDTVADNELLTSGLLALCSPMETAHLVRAVLINEPVDGCCWYGFYSHRW